MPIPLKQYQDGVEPQEAEILAKLEQKPYQAYTLDDLLPKSNNLIVTFTQGLALANRMDTLISKGLVKSKYIGLVRYYVSAKAT